MFFLSKIADVIQIHPEKFNMRSEDALHENINTKYANKVIQGLGLCISLWDICWASEGLCDVYTGLCNVNVEFRMVVFRPFEGEVLQARIVSQTEEGIHLTVGFFDDIFVPGSELADGAQFRPDPDSNGKATWVVDLEEDDEKLYYDNHEMVHFSVLSEEWHDQTPTGPVEAEADPADQQLLPPYKIIGTMNAPGLGVCLWWQE
ncbi:DNA-directed RNA polymerase III subunit rpc25 [Rhypophila decipiens]|uniref:DNA-directed RNA polymerase subunit n=1 Tax=Rhypophila decipiens TaxID=261697 RepID=A0AAN7BCH8_9PEZI|nr:DNA-directed RNA polymerase III subunit rpc25 [Rhypophila decipiens]